MSLPRPPRMPATLLALALAVGGGSLAAGCGIPTEGAARVIPKSQVPTNVITTGVPSTTTTSPQQGSATIYLVSGSRLAVEPRKLAGQVTLTAAIASLLKGPTTSERATGITTAINSGTKLLGTPQVTQTKTRETVTVDFNAAFAPDFGPPPKLAVAQVVYTVDAIAGTATPATVRFEVTKIPVTVPVTSGALTRDGVNTSNYQTVAPPRTS